MDILLVCTANQCRTAMAEGLLRRQLADVGIDASLGSAGLLPGGAPATDHAIAVMADRGVDIGAHRSRTLTDELATTTALVIGMARHHVREACVAYGAPIERTFTLKEIVRRGEELGARVSGESVASWLLRIGAGRRTADLVGDHPADDIADPVGQPREEYERTADELTDLLERFVDLLRGVPEPGTAYAEPGPRGRWWLGARPRTAGVRR